MIDVLATFEFLGEVAAFARNLFDATDIQPRALEHRLALDLVELRADRVLVGHRLGSQLGIVLRPAAFGRLGETSHRLLLSTLGNPPRTMDLSALRGSLPAARRYMLHDDNRK